MTKNVPIDMPAMAPGDKQALMKERAPCPVCCVGDGDDVADVRLCDNNRGVLLFPTRTPT